MQMAKDPIDVLLVDDDPDICLMLEAILKFSGYQVKYCSFAEHIPELLTQLEPKLILMDLYLSGIDGRTICKRIKAGAETAGIKIIMMSAHPDAKQTCLDAGSDDFLPKPFEIDSLVQLVQLNLAVA
jgi:DNA-binding response OmpR family regulator